MGLAVEVGSLSSLSDNDTEAAAWLRETLAQVNEVLVENGLPPHEEPEQVPKLRSRCAVLGFPYSYLHHLRRFFAHATSDPDWTPETTPQGEDPALDQVVEEESCMFMSHLLCHSDCEGFYLPLKFDDVIIDSTDQDRIPGGLLGSSYCLMEELVHIAPKLEIQLEGMELSNAEAKRINEDCRSQQGFWIEKTVWLALFEAARLSIEHATAIQFG